MQVCNTETDLGKDLLLKTAAHMFKTYFHNHCVFEGFPNPMVKTLRWYMFNWGGGGGDCFGMLALGVIWVWVVGQRGLTPVTVFGNFGRF